ncbi:MAG: peptidoglycan editing factor PgeF [Vicinamibacterales bacterium]
MMRVTNESEQGNGGFRFQQGPAGPVLVCEPLIDVAPHFFSTRSFVARAEDGLPFGARAVAAHLGVAPERVHDASQVHGAAIHVAAPSPSGRCRPEADILLAREPDDVVVVRAADCVPVLLADRRNGPVAAVHAGWRGTCAGAAARAVRALAATFRTRPEDIIAAVGPSIGACCYRVGRDVLEAFHEAWPPDRVADWFTAINGAWMLDLWHANRDQLLAEGVSANAIHVSRSCTSCELDRYFSYRREGQAAGRLVAAIRAGGRGQVN